MVRCGPLAVDPNHTELCYSAMIHLFPQASFAAGIYNDACSTFPSSKSRCYKDKKDQKVLKHVNQRSYIFVPLIKLC